ncbi:MAG TPA: hypothetical protein VH482_14420 [Thermomicrobiales bacterium]
MIPKTSGVGRRRAMALGLTLAAAILVAAAEPGAAAAKLQDGTDVTNIACALTAEVGDEVGATPEAPVESPVAEASPVAGQPADAATAAAIETLVRTLAACLSDGQSDTVVQLVTERYLGQVYGGGGRLPRADYLALAPDLPKVPVTVSVVTDVRRESADRANADVVTVVGNQLVHGRWTFVRTATAAGGSRWQVDAVTPLPVVAPPEASRVEVGLSDDKFALSPGTVAGPDVVLTGTNTGKEDHEMLVAHLDRGVSTDALLREPGPGLPDGVTFIGQVTIPPGGQADLVLVGLAPGSYAIVCLLPTEDGTPHLALGMKARLRITAPATG